MVAERISVEAVEAAVVEYDAQERAIVGRQAVMDFTQVGVMVSLLAPREWEEVAAYLLALLDRAPLKGGKAFVAHRTVIGALAGELRQYAAMAGQPVGLEVDLRAATSKAEERRIRERIADQEAAYDRHIDDAIEQAAVQRRYDATHEPLSEPGTDYSNPIPSDPQEEPPPTDQPDARTPTEASDATWLL